MKSKKRYLFFFGIIVAVTVLLIYFQESKNATNQSSRAETTDEAGISNGWRNTELTNVATGEKFRISDFSGKPVLVESFAVWCPTCLKQQKEIKKLKDSEGDSVIHVSLDTDPNEDESKVQGHIDRNGFDWFFAVTPEEMIKSLIAEFGIGVVNAPAAPVVLVCEDQSARFLKRNVKSADQLKAEIEEGCSA